MQVYSARLRTALWWIVPLLAIGATIGWETDWGRAVETVRPVREATAPTPVAVAVFPEYAIAGGTAAHPQTVERTLFNPTRRPAPVAAQEVAQPKMQRGQFSLTGTTVADGKSTAFLREATGKSRRVQAGDSINGLKVAEVRSDRVKLTLGDESEELVLKVAANPRPTVPQAATAALGSIPQPTQNPAQVVPPAPPAVSAGPETAQTLAERRRAARAGQSDAPPPVPGGATPPAPASAAAQTAPTSPDPRWQEVYRRYQERQR